MSVTTIKMIDSINIIEYVFNAFLVGVISWIWIIIILDVDNFGFIWSFFDSFMKKTAVTRFIFKPLFNCFYCFAGQASLWIYLFSYSLDGYNVFYHLGFISISILTTQIINKKYG